jgi:hypothetical protein
LKQNKRETQRNEKKRKNEKKGRKRKERWKVWIHRMTLRDRSDSKNWQFNFLFFFVIEISVNFNEISIWKIDLVNFQFLFSKFQLEFRVFLIILFQFWLNEIEFSNENC